MKNFIKFSFAAIFALILLAACSSEESNPLDPDNGGGDPDPVINTPKYMRIESIRVTNFSTTKPNGDKWDYHIFSNSPTRGPWVRKSDFNTSDTAAISSSSIHCFP